MHQNWPDAQMVGQTLDKGDMQIPEAVVSHMHHRDVKAACMYAQMYIYNYILI